MGLWRVQNISQHSLFEKYLFNERARIIKTKTDHQCPLLVLKYVHQELEKSKIGLNDSLLCLLFIREGLVEDTSKTIETTRLTLLFPCL